MVKSVFLTFSTTLKKRNNQKNPKLTLLLRHSSSCTLLFLIALFGSDIPVPFVGDTLLSRSWLRFISLYKYSIRKFFASNHRIENSQDLFFVSVFLILFKIALVFLKYLHKLYIQLHNIPRHFLHQIDLIFLENTNCYEFLVWFVMKKEINKFVWESVSI